MGTWMDMHPGTTRKRQRVLWITPAAMRYKHGFMLQKGMVSQCSGLSPGLVIHNPSLTPVHECFLLYKLENDLQKQAHMQRITLFVIHPHNRHAR
jgi:hypothetical protein